MRTTGHSQQHQVPQAPWASMTPAAQRAFLSTLSTRERRQFLESEANRLLSDRHSERYQGNADYRATHADGRPLFEEFDGDTNNSDDGEPCEIVLDGSNIPDSEPDGEAHEAHGPAQDQETALASSWVDCAGEESLWGMNEWNAVRSLAPVSLKNLDVLVGLAQGKKITDIAKLIGRSERQTRNNVQWRWKYVEGLDVREIVRHLDDPITTEIVERRPPSRARRKPRGRGLEITTEITTAEIILDLLGDPIPPWKLRKPRKPGVRRPRVRAENPLQMSLFDMAA